MDMPSIWPNMSVKYLNNNNSNTMIAEQHALCQQPTMRVQSNLLYPMATTPDNLFVLSSIAVALAVANQTNRVCVLFMN